ncbi:MAG: hypothetical protein K2X39_00430, partial [Silvanigrellaceae bacterium]|nr:hypothetical protein [Silvanigrellaceae bacterium]
KIDNETLNLLAKAGASFDSRLATKELLLLLQNKNVGIKEINFHKIATCIAIVYSFANEWPLVDEWLDIANRSQNLSDPFTRSKLFELEAFKLTMQGADYHKAQTLIEAAIDFYGNANKVPIETRVLHGYLLLAQGNINGGIEKIQNSIGENSSIQNLYFLIKGLDRAGKLNHGNKDAIEKIFQQTPTNFLEQKLIEEIFFTVGKNAPRFPTQLIC